MFRLLWRIHGLWIQCWIDVINLKTTTARKIDCLIAIEYFQQKICEKYVEIPFTGFIFGRFWVDLIYYWDTVPAVCITFQWSFNWELNINILSQVSQSRFFLPFFKREFNFLLFFYLLINHMISWNWILIIRTFLILLFISLI